MKTKQELLDGLKAYTLEWEAYLDEHFEDCDYQMYKQEIQEQYNKVMERVPSELSIKDELNSVLKNTLLKIKEKELEINSFKEHTNIKEILVDDHNVLIQRRKAKLLAEIKKDLYKPKLKDLSQLGEQDQKYKYIHNAMYYRKEFVKKLQEYKRTLKQVEIELGDEFDNQCRVVLGHISFLNIGMGSSEQIVKFTMDNLDLYKKHDEFLVKTLDNFKKDYLGVY